jgi:DNA repair protein RadC
MMRSRRLSEIKILTPIIGHRAAREVLSHYRIADIPHLDRRRLLQMPYIGPRRAEALLTLPRILQQLALEPVEGLYISCSRDVYDLFRLRLATLTREQFMVLTLNSRNRILAEDTCAVGSVNTVHVNPSEVIREAVIRSAPSIICLHNHPSGDPTPSPEDRLLTERIAHGATLLGVRMLDHVILTVSSYYSFSDAGAL